MRLYNVAAAFLMLCSAFILYGFNYETRSIETHVRSLERRVGIAQKEIALLKAEKAHLSRPERIELFARREGLQPLKPNQIVQDPLNQFHTSSK